MTATSHGLEPIPSPPQKPLIGNLLDLSGTTPIADLVALARELGPIYQLDMMGKTFCVVSGHELVAELCDETRFDKSVRGGLHKVREIAGDGLFTAYSSEPNWAKAHSILLPNFGPRAMQGYHPMMLDVAQQLMLKWQRLNADDEVDVVHDMTALTLDTIGLCGFGYRLNSFYREDNHPFITAMVDALGIAMTERGLPLEQFFNRAKQQRMDNDARTMNAVVDRIIADRKAEMESGGAEKTDLLGYMLTGVDRKTGERLDDTNIRYQIITFLIAGHETTSGLLSFAIYFLLNHPDVLARAYDEVDRVFGDDTTVVPTVKAVNALTYIAQILKETLRLWPPAPAFAVLPYKDEVIGGKYFLKARSQVMILLPMLHRDKTAWGEGAERFDPENFAPAAEAARPSDAYKPFGNGRRACIGRQFAMQEAALVLGMMLQRFKLIDHRRYELHLKESLTVKLDGLKIKVRPRRHAGAPAASASASASSPAASNGSPVAAAGNGAPVAAVAAPQRKHGTPLLVLFGSNLGSAEDAARQLAEAGTAQGYDVKLAWLDDYAGKLPTEGAVMIVCASYNGAPPENAAAFYAWLHDDAPRDLAGVKYSVFGCGNRNWTSTYQAVPRLIDERLAASGAQRLYARGEGDAREDLDEDFEAWRGPLWRTVAEALNVPYASSQEAERPAYALEFVPPPQPNNVAAVHGAAPMRVVLNRELQNGTSRSTRHLEIELGPGVRYRSGDHLGVVPANSPALVERVLQRFGLDGDSYVRLRPGGIRHASLPTGEPVAVAALLATYLELQQTATRKQVALLLAHTACPPEKARLAELATGDDAAYRRDVKDARASVLDMLEAFPSCELPFAAYFDMLPLLTPRYYSISSSPLALPERCSITVAVVRDRARPGRGSYEGVCSTYLERFAVGERLNAFVRDSKSGFRLPDDPQRPLVMIGPGTGLAPFRAFLQERSVLRERGVRLGGAMLFFGCRRPDEDFIYREELEALAAAGHVNLHVAFSREGPARTYVQDLLVRQADDVFRALDAGAVIYVCGDGSRMEPGVRETLVRLYREREGCGEQSASAWFTKLVDERRYVLDVWASA